MARNNFSLLVRLRESISDYCSRVLTIVNQMKANEAYKNKHGLHKKPPVQVPQKLKVDLTQIDENEENFDTLEDRKKLLESVNKNNPPRVSRKVNRGVMDDNPQPNKRFKTPTGKVK